MDAVIELVPVGRPQQSRGGRAPAYSQFKDMYAAKARQEAALREMTRRAGAPAVRPIDKRCVTIFMVDTIGTIMIEKSYKPFDNNFI